MSLNNSIVTQSIGIPYQQYVTSSAGHTFVSSSTYFNDTSDNIPRYKDADGTIFDVIISSSYALTASHALNSGEDAFPFTGDAQITGSLIISGSFEPRGLGGETNVIIGGAGAGSSISEVYATHNVIIGYDAAEQLNDEDYNVIIGSSAGNFLTHGVNNVLIGGLTGRNLKGSTGNKIKGNTLIGHYAGYGGTNANSFSANNTGLGEKVLYEIDGGSGSIAIGYFAGYNIGSGNNNIIIGSGSLGTTTMNDQLRIGHADLHVISASLETGEILLNTTTISGSLLNTGTVSLDNTDSPYTITGTQQFILIDPSGGDVTINMPDVATYPGREIRFKLTQAAGANTVTLQRQGADTIDGATTYTDLDIQYESISTVSDGSTGWFIF
jgi:hypothetical protein